MKKTFVKGKFLSLTGCFLTVQVQNGTNNFTYNVHPDYGTKMIGHDYPDVTIPFGTVSLKPDTDTFVCEAIGCYYNTVSKYCTGYQFTNKTIISFSQSGVSDTGYYNFGDIVVMDRNLFQ